MGRVDLDSVHSRGFRPDGGFYIAVPDPFYILNIHCAGQDPDTSGGKARIDDCAAGYLLCLRVGLCHGTRVVYLQNDRNAVFVNDSGELFEPFDGIISGSRDLSGRGFALRTHIYVLRDDEAQASGARLFIVVAENIPVYKSVCRFLGRHGRHDKPCLELQAPDLNGCI